MERQMGTAPHVTEAFLHEFSVLSCLADVLFKITACAWCSPENPQENEVIILCHGPQAPCAGMHGNSAALK